MYVQKCWDWYFTILIDIYIYRSRYQIEERERERESEDEWEPEVPAGDHWGFELVSGVVGLYCDLQQGPY